MYHSESAWAQASFAPPPIYQLPTPSSPNTQAFSLLAIQQQERDLADRVKQPIASLAEIQEEERKAEEARVAEVEFMRWWQDEEARIAKENTGGNAGGSGRGGRGGTRGGTRKANHRGRGGSTAPPKGGGPGPAPPPAIGSGPGVSSKGFLGANVKVDGSRRSSDPNLVATHSSPGQRQTISPATRGGRGRA